MKKSKIFVGALAILLMASCSSNDEPKPETPDVNGTDNYVTVNILASGTENGRAASDFTDGDNTESKVNNALFMFFDSTGKLIDYSTPAIEWKDNSSNPENPAVTKVGSVEINLKEGLSYNKVVVALNPSAEGIAQLYSDVKNMSDLNKFYKNYASLANATGNAQRFVMSTSAYYADAARTQLVNSTPHKRRQHIQGIGESQRRSTRHGQARRHICGAHGSQSGADPVNRHGQLRA